MKQFIIDAFTERPFSGNPAAVCLMETWPTEEGMRKLAMENNLSETAFLVPVEGAWELRWFTPAVEVGLCGHATLAAAWAVFRFCTPEAGRVTFRTKSGLLTVTRRGELLEMNFPLTPQREIPVTEEMERAFGLRPLRALLGLDLVCVFADEAAVRGLRPEQALLAALPGRIQNATAPGRDTDCVSRSFCPKLGIPEDPVCGSAHCQIAPYWAETLGKRVIEAWQASPRGGRLRCTIGEEGRIAISGRAVLISVGEVVAELE